MLSHALFRQLLFATFQEQLQYHNGKVNYPNVLRIYYYIPTISGRITSLFLSTESITLCS